MSTVSTHVLDTAVGRPGVGIEVRLERVDADAGLVATGTTDADGRVGELGPESLPAGTYRLVFDTGAYFTRSATAAFFPQVSVTFVVTDAGHYHVPVLLSPFAFSTYRGS